MSLIAVRSLLCGAVVASATAVVAAEDVVIGQISTDLLGTGTAERLESVAVILGIDEPGSLLGEHHTSLLFETHFWSNADVAVAAVADVHSDPEFATVAERFTNGSDDRVWVGVVWHLGDGFTGGGGPESLHQFEDPAGVAAIDLRGFRLNRIEMTVDNFAIDVPGADPSQDGQWTNVRGLANFTFFGQPVPEPSSALVALTALFSVGRWATRLSPSASPAF